MNLVLNNYENQIIDEAEVIVFPKRNFIEANTTEVSLNHLQNKCTVPVFAKDNECTISHYEFINSTKEVVEDILDYKGILKPDIRVSHVIKGRVPTAIGKPAKDLLEDEKTIYYERCMFLIEIPEISEIINGNKLNLTILGVRSYSQENLFSKKSLEKFKVAVGFNNTVCTNLCISTDGLKEDLRVSSVLELKAKIYELINSYKKKEHLISMERMFLYSLSEIQFAHLIGRLRMYQHLEKEEQKRYGNFLLNDGQVNSVVRDYYSCPNFSRDNNHNISLWNLYNLLTEANKSSYIDSNLERNVNAYAFINNLINSIENQSHNWYLNN